MPKIDAQASAALAHLSAADPVMARLINERGPLVLTSSDDYFFTLLGSIVSQQLSSKAAATILDRVVALFPGKASPDPASVLALPYQAVCDAGLSWRKVRFI